MKNWKLSPSDFAFLWEECQRCFYLKVARNYQRPRTPFPKVFTIIDGLMKDFFEGKRSEEISPSLPPGVVKFGEKWVESEPISIPGRDSTCFVRGKTDTIIEFDDGTYSVIDFKTTHTRSEHVSLYGRQLHAYALALEQAAQGKFSLSPISILGLLCVEPSDMSRDSDGRVAYLGDVTWIECPRDDEAFHQFLGDVVELLDSPDPPGGNPSCTWCQYRDTARRTHL